MKTVRLYNKHEDYESKKDSEVYINKYCLSYCMDQKDCHVYDKTVVTMDWLVENTNSGITKQIDEDENTITYIFKENLIDELDVFSKYKILDFNAKYTNNEEGRTYTYCFIFNKRSISQDFANYIVNLVNNTPLDLVEPIYLNFNIPEFKGEINILCNRTSSIDYHYYSIDNVFNGCEFTKITITTQKNVVLGSLVNAFKGASKLQSIDIRTVDGDYPVPQNSNAGVAGAFEFCGNLKKLPKLYYKYFSNCGYAFELCGIDELPIFDENDNTIYLNGYAPQMFNSCNWLRKIHPILDLGITEDTKESDFYRCIAAEGLTSVKLKGITKFNIDFINGTGGFLIPQIDAESALYAINNALDVTELGGLYMNFPSIANQNGELNAVVDSAKAKGWTIKVDGQEIHQS